MSKKDRKKIEWMGNQLLPAILFSYALTFFLKLFFHVPRPCLLLDECPSTYSFPSGHAAVAFTFATISFLNRGSWVYLLPFPLAFLVCLSRIFLNFHHPIDVVAGSGIGLIVGVLFKELGRKIKLVK